MGRERQIGERDWEKRPLFARRRRRPWRWIVLLLMLGVGLWLLFSATLPPPFG